MSVMAWTQVIGPQQVPERISLTEREFWGEVVVPDLTLIQIVTGAAIEPLRMKMAGGHRERQLKRSGVELEPAELQDLRVGEMVTVIGREKETSSMAEAIIIVLTAHGSKLIICRNGKHFSCPRVLSVKVNVTSKSEVFFLRMTGGIALLVGFPGLLMGLITVVAALMPKVLFMEDTLIQMKKRYIDL